jgi:GAF domain-containing protein/HAMP domain-containing protein
MSTSVTASARRPSIRRTLLIYSLLLVVLPSLVFIGIGTMSSYQARLQRTRSQLLATSDLKQWEIERWVKERESDLSVLSNQTALQQSLQTMLDSPEGSPEHLAAYSEVAVALSGFLRKKVAFVELFLIDTETGQTVVSTEVTREGRSNLEEAFFREGQKGPYLQPPVFDPAINAPTILIARPIPGSSGGVLAVLGGRANLADLGTLIQAEAGLGKTGETYLVSTEGFYIAGSQRPEAAPASRLDSIGIRAALNGEEGVGQYINYRGEGVFGAYRWLSTMNVALLIEQSQAEVITAAASTALVIGIVGLVAALIASGAALLLTRRIVRPIVELIQAATQIAGGDLERAAPVRRADEIGTLARAFNQMTNRLRDLITNLEQRVADRTRDLERRAVQLQAAAQVGRAAASVRDVDELLSQVTHLISERFGFYHIGVFLLDDMDEYAVLRAANSEGGQQMLAQGHKLKVGEQGIVGYVTGKGEARIALDVGHDAVHFKNPLLPHTRSEMTLPLIAGGRMLGALDVQSTEEAAFAQEDIAVLQVLADQVAMAIENARLFEELQTSLQEISSLYQRSSQEAWQMVAGAIPTGYEYDRARVVPIDHRRLSPDVVTRLQAGRVITLEAEQGEDGHRCSTLIAPVILRGQVIGAIGFEEDDPDHQWSPEDIAVVETVTSQVALALENARLFEETQRLALQEQSIRQITEQMRRAVDVETILEITVTQLGQAMGAPRSYVRLGTEPIGPLGGKETYGRGVELLDDRQPAPAKEQGIDGE